MKFAHFLALIAGFTTPAFSETLVSGAIYFDSENTLQEVLKLSGSKDNEALGRLIATHHVSEKLAENTDIQLYLAGPGPESPAEFRFINNPTTYWTLTKFVEGIYAVPSATPMPVVVVPTPTPNVTPNATPTPLPSPTPTPKSAVAMQEREEPSDSETSPPPPLRKHHRVKVKEHRSPSSDEGVPDSQKVWHQVNGHWKWYDKRNLKEVRRALAPSEVLPVASPPPNVPPAVAIPNLNFNSRTTLVPRALPVAP